MFRLAPEQLLYNDLSRPLDVGRRYDLASCMEVAEHLPAAVAPILIENLVKLAPVVLFGAAVPAQYGIHHVNCQWPEYWTALFDRFGYRPLDIVRWKVWENPEVEWWYRQNVMLYASPEFLDGHPELHSAPPPSYSPRLFRLSRRSVSDLPETLPEEPAAGGLLVFGACRPSGAGLREGLIKSPRLSSGAKAFPVLL